MFARTHADLHNVRLGVERIRTVSDRLIGLGPFGIGLDGILSFFPVLGVIYSGGAALMLLAEAIRARASTWTLAHMGLLLFVDTALDIPGSAGLGILSGAADTLFTGHKWSANLLLRHMDDTLYIEGSRAQARGSPEYAELMADVRARREKRRIVFLG